MSVLTWWLIPLVATLGAIVVISVANRPRGPGPSDRSVEEFERFRTALEQTQGRTQGDNGHAADHAGDNDDPRGSSRAPRPGMWPGSDS